MEIPRSHNGNGPGGGLAALTWVDQQGHSPTPSSDDDLVVTLPEYEYARGFAEGYEKGQSEYESIQLERLKAVFTRNRGAAEASASRFYYELIKHFNLTAKSMFVRADSLTEWIILAIIDHDFYSSEKMVEMVTYAQSMEESVRSDNFILDFVFMPHSETIEVRKIWADGFFRQLTSQRD